jgi:hypothetical protein
MGSAVLDTTIGRSAEEVWAAIRDFGELGWYPHVDSCVVVDGVRTVTGHGRDLEIDERLTHHDDRERTFAYVLTDLRGETQLEQADGSVVDIAHLVDHLRAGMVVQEVDTYASRVTYWLEIDEGHDAHLASTARNYQRAIDNLKVVLEG